MQKKRERITCPFKDKGCTPEFICLSCIYKDEKDKGDIEECRKLWIDFGTILSEDFKESEEKAFMSGNLLYGPSAKVGEREPKPKGLPPTQKQLDYLEILAARARTAMPQVSTLDEAKAAIEKLKSGTMASNDATQKQIEYLRSLAYQKLGPNSEDWVQKKIAEGKKSVSDAITMLRAK